MKRSFLDIRLWHKDYKMPTSKKAIKAIQDNYKIRIDNYLEGLDKSLAKYESFQIINLQTNPW